MDITIMVLYEEGKEDPFMLEEQKDSTWELLGMDGKVGGPFGTLKEGMDHLTTLINERRYN